MRISRVLLALVPIAVLAAARAPVQAGAELKLADGQVLRGASVELKDDMYALRLASGTVLSVPAGLVKELRLVDDEKPAPTAFRETEGEVIAGPPRPVKPPKPAEQTRALGPPATFRTSPVQGELPGGTYWYPDPAGNEFNPSKWSKGVFDPIWTPRSAFDGSKNVLAAGRSRWRTSSFDPVWWPVDGFTKESPGDLPEREAPKPAARATPDEQVERTREVVDATARLMRTQRQAIDGVFDLVVRAAKQADGEAPAPVLLATRADLERIASSAGACPLPRSKRDAEAGKAGKAFSEPRVDARDGADVVRFLTWSARGGVVVRHVAVEDDEGRRTLRDEIVAEHVGNHDERQPR